MRVSAIAAIGKNRELGKNNRLIWTIPDDLKRFRELTTGHPVIMGRKTFESILNYTGGKPLPNRTNIVVSHQGRSLVALPLVAVCCSVEDAIERGGAMSEEIFILGGAQIFAAAFPKLDKLYLTLIDAEDRGADTFFPEYEKEFLKDVSDDKTVHEWNGLHYHYADLERG